MQSCLARTVNDLMLNPTELTLTNKKLVCFVIEKKCFSFMLETSKIVDIGSRL
jgi:hypothetical protein